MSTKGTVAFTRWDGELEAAVYLHNAGAITPEFFEKFFATVARDCGPAAHDLRFHDAPYLAAKFTVWCACTASMAFQGIGVITDPARWHAHRRFTVRCHQESSAELPEVTEDEPAAPVPVAVITADPTIMDGLVVRWRANVNGPSLLSASRNRVMVHGDVTLTRIEPWLDDARRAHEALKAGRDDEARALATHEEEHMFGDLVPIKRSNA